MSALKRVFKKKKLNITSYADFWAWFQEHEKSFYAVVKNKDNVDENFFELLSPALEALGHTFYYVTGMFDSDTVELIITAEGNVKNFVFVEELVGAAPQLAGWRFTAHKPSGNIDDFNIQMSGYEFDKDNLHFYPVENANRPDAIELVVVHPAWTEENKDVIGNGIHIFLDNYLGELNFAMMVDHIYVAGPGGNREDLIPIIKLRDYLTWREKEFVEKYEGSRHETAKDTYSTFEARRESGMVLIGFVNTDLLRWDRKASHPWMLKVEIDYVPNERGLPDDAVYASLNEVEEGINSVLKDFEGYLNVGRLTADGVRTVYFACREFRKPSQVLSQVAKQYAGKMDIQYDIYKDKYWRTFDWLGIR